MMPLHVTNRLEKFEQSRHHDVYINVVLRLVGNYVHPVHRVERTQQFLEL